MYVYIYIHTYIYIYCRTFFWSLSWEYIKNDTVKLSDPNATFSSGRSITTESSASTDSDPELRFANLPSKIKSRGSDSTSIMSLEESRRSQRPYRYGMVLLCVGALINWLGLAENYVEPVRYVGVACIVAGALLICAAMCCWLHAPPTRASVQAQHTNHPITAQIDDPIHVISVEEPSITNSRQKPPDYEAVADAPPSYDDAIKLNPAQLAMPSNSNNSPAVGTRTATTPPVVVTIIGTVGTGGLASVEPTAPSPPPPYAR